MSLPEGDVLSLSDPVSASASPRKSVSPDRPRKANRSRTRGGKLSDATNPLFGHNINPIVSLPAPVEDEAVIEDTQASENHVRRRHRAFSPPVYDSLEDATDQGYMKLFSPVKRKRVIKAASLPEKKAENMNKSTDPRIRAETQTSDHRSAISAPQLWEDQPKEAEIANINKETVPEMEDYGFGAFQTDTQKETTTADDTLPGTGKSSVFDVLSSVPATQIRMEERTDDGRILSEIKSIRAMFSGKSKESSGKDTNPPLLAPFLPNISKSTPSSRVGTAPAAASTLRRTVSFPDGKIYPSDIYTSDEVESTEHVGDKSFVKPPTNEPENAESAQAQEILLEPEVQKEEPAEEEDIWLAQTVTSRASRKLSRKRKKDASGDEDIVNTTINPSPAVGINLSRSTSSARSSKSRKTVSWSDDPEPQQQLSRGDIFPTPIAMASSSMIGEYSQSGASSQHRINSTQTATIATETGPNTVSTDKPSSEGSSDGKSIEQIVKAALVEMQRAMCLQMSSMQAEMGRQFREQNHELQGLKNEMERVRLENEKLRNMLFKSTGVRESVKKAGGPSGGTQLR